MLFRVCCLSSLEEPPRVCLGWFCRKKTRTEGACPELLPVSEGTAENIQAYVIDDGVLDPRECLHTGFVEVVVFMTLREAKPVGDRLFGSDPSRSFTLQTQDHHF